jgi:outer membrane receptor protein involved in Fe transport
VVLTTDKNKNVMKKIVPILVLLWMAGTAYGQLSGVKGVVVDETGEGIPFGNVAVLKLPDSTQVAGHPTDENGAFSFSLENGNYVLKITVISFKEKLVSGVRVNGNNTDLGRVRLAPDVATLAEVVVQGERSQMQLDLDKRVFNVGADLASIGGSAVDILNNVPSVSVDPEGVVSLRGSENVKILIDGRPSGLTGIGSPDALRLLQGNMIDRIEVITNPSSRYDAEGEVGIINIVLKKNVNQGLNGAFSINMGYPLTYGGSFDLSYRREKFNFFGTYGYNLRTTKGSGNSFQRFTTADSLFSYRENSSRQRQGRSHMLRGGMEYYLNDNEYLGAAILYRTGRGTNTSRYEFLDFDENDVLFRSSVRSETEKEPETNVEASLSYKKEFEQKGRTLTADVKLIDSQELELADFLQTSSVAADLFQKSSNTENERNFLVQADYVHPFGAKGKFEAGLKSSSRRIVNDFSVDERDELGNWSMLPQFDNHLVYDEKIHAAYFMAGDQFGKFSVQGGLRGEFSDIATALPEVGTKNHRTYFNLFPSVHFSYQLPNDKSMQLSYSRRLSRPWFRQLLPFSGFSNNRSLRVGNPDLDPEYTNSLEASYLANWENASLLGSVYYRYRTGVIQSITLVDSVGFNRIYPVNLSTQNAYGLELNGSVTIDRWWKLNGNFNFFRAITEGRFEGKDYGSDTYAWLGRFTSKMTLWKFDFQAGINYRSSQITLQGKQLPTYNVDLGLARDILKGRGTVIFSVQDLFQTRRWKSIVDQPEFYSYSNSLWRGRQFLVTINYRLNRKKSGKDSLQDMNEGGGGDGG